jgi:arginine/lysine/ornithine decarboxylase
LCRWAKAYAPAAGDPLAALQTGSRRSTGTWILSKGKCYFFSGTEVVPARDAIGRVSANTLSAYPPGIPNLMAGEVVTPEAIEFLQATIRVPFGHLRGGVSSDMSHIRVTI